MSENLKMTLKAFLVGIMAIAYITLNIKCEPPNPNPQPPPVDHVGQMLQYANE